MKTSTSSRLRACSAARAAARPAACCASATRAGFSTRRANFQVVSKEAEPLWRLDPEGDCHQVEIFVPVARFDVPLEAAVSLKYRGKTIEKAVSIPPQRPWEVHLVHQTHLDIGYTHTQEDVLARQVQSLKDALRYIDQTRDYPDAARFRFHPEGMWAVDEFMRTASDAEQEALVRAARARDIHLDGMYAQAMTGMYNDEELFELLAGAARFGKAHRVTVDSAMQTDVPGYTWGLVSALAANGIRYMTMGPNGGHRVGRVYYWADRPFWWESPSGKQARPLLAFGLWIRPLASQPVGRNGSRRIKFSRHSASSPRRTTLSTS